MALALPVFPVGASPLRDDVRDATQLAAAYAAFERGLPSGGAGDQGLVVELELPEALALVRAHGVRIYFVNLHVFDTPRVWVLRGLFRARARVAYFVRHLVFAVRCNDCVHDKSRSGLS